MTPDTRRKARQRERRTRRIEDKQLTAIVAAIGGGSDDDWDQDSDWLDDTADQKRGQGQ